MQKKPIDGITAGTIPSSLRWDRYLELCKPKVVLLIAFTAIVGMLLSTPGPLLAWELALFGTIGIALAAASGAALNHLADRHIDAIMARTRMRPLPQGEVDALAVLVFALGLGVASMCILYFLVNALTALLSFLSLIGYAVVYTLYLKRATPQNIVLGGAAGATPPLLGWTAITGEIHVEAVLLFLIVFVWTPPHFWSLAIRRRKEYAGAGIPMLPVTHGVAFTKLQILIYTVLLTAVSLLPFVIGMSGLFYLLGAIALDIGFLRHAIILYRSESDRYAMKTFSYSIFYLSLLFVVLLADHYIRIVLQSLLV
ncbi:MAG: heme o synthase [Candidatus Thiodiazotropha sp.]